MVAHNNNSFQWGLSAPPPQVITIDYKAPNGWKTSNPIGSCTASYIIPPLLHTNSESRHVGKTIYKKEFADRLGGNGIWIDVDTDILYFCRSAVFVGFFGGRIIDRQFNPRGYKTPLNQHHLPAVAYSTVSDLAGYLHPEALASIGRPKTIYQIRADLSMMEIRRVVWMRVHFHETWDMLRFKTWLEKIEYKKPAVMSLRLEELKSKLVSR